VFGKNRFRNDGVRTAGTNEPHNRRDEMNCKDDQTAHVQMLAA
jgi:hypothetical protein